MRSGWSSASIFWVLLAWGRFPVSKAIIPDAQEHFLTPSAHRDTHLFGGLGVTRLCEPKCQQSERIHYANYGYQKPGRPPLKICHLGSLPLVDNRNGYLVTDPNGNGTGAGGRVSLAGPSSPTVTLSTYLVLAPDSLGDISEVP